MSEQPSPEELFRDAMHELHKASRRSAEATAELARVTRELGEAIEGN